MVSSEVIRILRLRWRLLLKILLLRAIRRSPGYGKQDLSTELMVAVAQSFFDVTPPITKQQKALAKDPGIKGAMWISKVTLPNPEEDDVRHALFKAFDEMRAGVQTFITPDVLPVEAEWTGHRRGVDNDAPQPDISEGEKYMKLLEDATEDGVILYAHGGAFW